MKNAFLSFLALLLLVLPGAAETPERPPEMLLWSIQNLGIELHDALRCNLANPEAPVCPVVDLGELRSRAGQLSAVVDSATGGDRTTVVERKLEQLEGLLHNLGLLAVDPAIASGLPSPEIGLAVAGAAATATDSPSNDGCNSPQAVGIETVSGSTTDASNDGQAGCGASLFSPDIWYEFTAPFGGIFFANTIGSSFDTVLSTHSGCPGTIDNQVDCNDDHFGLMSSIRLDLTAGETLLIRVAGVAGATGDVVLNIAEDARIGGTVTAADGGAPLASFAVKAFNLDGYWMASGQSDLTGEYLVTGLNQDEHYVGTAYGTRYINELYDGIPCPIGPPSDCDPTEGSPVATTLGQTMTLDFALEYESSISGTLTTAPSGVPLASAYLVLYDSDGEPIRSFFSDAAGEYTFPRLATGNYYLAATATEHIDELWNDHPCPGGPPNGCAATDGDPITVGIADMVTGIDFQLTEKGTISGVVTEDGTGLPISNADVVAISIFLGYSHRVHTAADGTFTITGLEDRDYIVAATTDEHHGELYDDVPCDPDCDLTLGTPVVAAAGTPTTNIDFALLRFGEITGTVTVSGTSDPLESIRVAVYDHAGINVGTELTTSFGSYIVSGLPPGDYYVRTEEGSSYSNKLYDGIACPFTCNPTVGTPVAVSMATVTAEVDLELESTGTIFGNVNDAATAIPIQFKGIELWHRDHGLLEIESTSPTGHYSFEVPAGGDYFVATAYPTNHLDELFDDIPCPGGPPTGCDPTKGTELVVSPSQATQANFHLVDLSRVLFIDGFESGFTGAWSSASP